MSVPANVASMQVRTARASRGRALAGLVAILLAAALAAPSVFPNPYYLHILCIALLFGVLAASWDLLFGCGGQISFGHAGFFGVGAYGSALVSYYAGINPWISLWIGAALAALFGAIVAMPALRLRGVYLALTTLAFAELARIVAVNWQEVTRGTLGFASHSPLPGLGFTPDRYYFVILAFTILSVGFMYWLGRRSRTGLIMRAMRSDETRASAFGANVFRYKLLAFVVSAFFAGAAGAIYGHYVRIVTPGEMEPKVGVLIIAMAIIGGSGSLIGPAVAGIVIHMAIELLAIVGPVYKFTAVGLVLILFVLFLPRGLAGLASDVFDRWQGMQRSSEERKDGL